MAVRRRSPVAARRRRRRAAVHVQQRAHPRDRRAGAPPAGAALRRRREGHGAVGGGAAGLGAGVRPAGARRPPGRLAAGRRAPADGAAGTGATGCPRGSRTPSPCGPSRRCTRRSSTRWSPPSRPCIVEVDDSTENPLVVGGRHTAAPRRLRDRAALRDARRAAPGDLPGDRAVGRPAVGTDQPVATGLPAFLASGPGGQLGRDDPGVPRPGRPGPRPDPDHPGVHRARRRCPSGWRSTRASRRRRCGRASRWSSSPRSCSAASWSRRCARSAWTPARLPDARCATVYDGQPPCSARTADRPFGEDLTAAVRLVEQGLRPTR